MANETSIKLSNDFTYNGVLSNDVLFKPSVGTLALSDIVGQTIPGIQYKTQLNLSPILSNIVKKAGGASADCTLPVSDGVRFSNREIEVNQMGFRIPWCRDEFENALNVHLAQEYMKTGIESYDPSAQILSWSDRVIEDALRRDVFRIFSFGDTASGSANYDQMDGYWNKIIAGAGTLTQKVGTEYGATLADGEAKASFEAMIDGAPIVLKQLPRGEKAIYCTGSLYENYKRSLQVILNGTSPEQYTITVNGVDGLSIDGIAIIPVYAWDDALTDPNNPLSTIQPHLAVYTAKNNHAIAVDGVQNLADVDGFYDRRDLKFYFDANFRMGYNLIHEDFTVFNTGATI